MQAVPAGRDKKRNNIAHWHSKLRQAQQAAALASSSQCISPLAASYQLLRLPRSLLTGCRHLCKVMACGHNCRADAQQAGMAA